MSSDRYGSAARALRSAFLASGLVAVVLVPQSGAAASALRAGTATSAARAYVLRTPSVALELLPAGKLLHVVLGLNLRDVSGLQTLIRRMHTPGDEAYGSVLTPGEFAARFAPTPARVRQLTDWLTSLGFQNLHVAANRLLVSADGPPAVVEAAFATPVKEFTTGGNTVFANTKNATLPSSMNGLVSAVLGLQNAIHARTFAQPGVHGVTLNGMAKAYGADALPPASRQTVAMFMAGDLTDVLADLQLSEQQNGLPSVSVEIVNAGAPGTQYSDTSNLDEWDLDSQSAQGIAGSFAKMIWYNAGTLSNRDLIVAFNRWVSDDRARAASASFGECETDAKASGFMRILDQILQQAVVQGQTLFASAGDSGGVACPTVSGAGIALGQTAVNYPASSPYAVAVGGTTLATNSDDSYVGESAWNKGGGGVSADEPVPSWQNGVIPSGTGGRGVPDLAMDADPESCAIIIVAGQVSQVGGTSLAAPLAMGAWARIEQARGSQGFAAPALYALSPGVGQSATGFHDVTTGATGTLGVLGGYSASRGWDYATGLGTFDVAAVAQALAAPNPPLPAAGGAAQPSVGVSRGTSSSGGGTIAPGLLLLLAGAGLWRRRRRRVRTA